MSKRQWLVLAGVIIIILPFLGLPSRWDRIITVIAGVSVIVIAYTSRSSHVQSSPRGEVPFSDHKNDDDVDAKHPPSSSERP